MENIKTIEIIGFYKKFDMIYNLAGPSTGCWNENYTGSSNFQEVIAPL